MTGLLDIAPQRAGVEVLGHTLEVEGVTVRGIADLLRRFPELLKLFGGGESPAGAIVAAAPDLVAAVIACGLGHMGDEEQEAAAARLPAEAQAELVGAILKLTMPSGVGPFVTKLAAAFGAVTGQQGTQAMAQTSRSPAP
jgi:hypothetical protein